MDSPDEDINNGASDESEEEHNESDPQSDNVESEEDRSNIRSELRDMPFAELIKLKNQLGSKVYNEAMFGVDAKATRKRKQPKLEFKRENKNRPRETTSKKQVSLMGSKKSKFKHQSADGSRDPRFDSRCGDFDRDQFKQNYDFVGEIRQKEAVELKEQLKQMGNGPSDEKKKLKLLLQRMENQNLEEKKLKERKLAKVKEKTEIKEAVKSDKKPFFASKREQKARELVKQYLELKDAGKLNKHLEKRRKKNTARDRKKYNFD